MSNKTTAYSYIRFSSKQQEQGDSLRRQLEASQQWATANNIQLSTDNYQDLGISAFKDKVRASLDDMLTAVETGRIAKGSWIILENLDRLSRKGIDHTQEVLRQILRKGVNIVSLSSGLTLTQESLNDLVSVIRVAVEADVAHKEILKRQERIKAAKQTAYDKALTGEKSIASKQLDWLDKKDGKFVENEYTDTYRLIFSMAESGIASTSIADRLNKDNVKRPVSTSGKTLWNEGKIRQILTNRIAIGVLVSDKGDIEDYYPSIVSKETFYKVGELMKTRKKRRVNQTTMRNLFSGFIKCRCGCTMTVKTAHNMSANQVKRSGYTFSCPSKKKTGVSCGGKNVWAYPLEKVILETLPVLDVSPLQTIDKTPVLKGDIEALESQQNHLTNNLMNVSGKAAEALQKRFQAVSDKLETLEAELKEAQAHQHIETPKITYNQDQIEAILDKGNVELRQQVSNQLQMLVDKIEVNTQENIIYIALKTGRLYTMKHTRNEYQDAKIYSGDKILDVAPAFARSRAEGEC